MENVSAILCSDIHLREDTPICRIDDFIVAQILKLKFIKKLQHKYNCKILHAGDLFHHWKPSPHLLSMAIQNLPINYDPLNYYPCFYTIFGQHDLPQHNIDLAYKCGITTLAEADSILILENEEKNIAYPCHAQGIPYPSHVQGTHYGAFPLKKESIYTNSKKILVWHHLTWEKSKPHWDSRGSTAEEVLDMYPEYDLIVTGDNHEGFVVEKDGRLLVNPGCMTRQSASQIDYKPRIYLWEAKTNEVECIYLPIEKNVITKEHLEQTQERNKRIDAFVSGLNQQYEQGLNFEDNLTKFSETNDVRKSVMDIVWKAIQKE